MTKVSKAELYRNIARAIDGCNGNILPKFPTRYYVTKQADGMRLCLKDMGDDVVRYIQESDIASTILQWLAEKVVADFGEYQLDWKNAVEATRVWKAMTKPISGIKAVSWQTDRGYTFHRLPWDPAPGPHPTFDEMMARTSNSRALMCFIGSLLEGRSDMQQYVWLHGQGQDGKGSLSRFLFNLLGPAYSSETPPSTSDKFWTSGLMGKRLVVFPDCNNQTFVTSGLFKSLSGGDPVRIEMKHQPVTTMPLVAKYMFISNEQPAISSEKADQRRLIYCEMQTIDSEPDPNYQNRLWAEGGAFLSSCIQIYRADCPDHGLIPVDKSDEALANLTSMNEEDFESAFERNFTLDPNAYVMPSAFLARLNEIWPRDRRRQGEFRAWLARAHGIRKMTHHGIKGDPKTYRGVSLIFEGESIQLSQQRQKDLQDSWKKKGMSQGQSGGRLKVVEREDGDGRDSNFTI